MISLELVGWVEVKVYQWRAVIKAENLVTAVDSRGFRYFLRKIAPNRGLPQNAARETRFDLDEQDGYQGANWITWAEMKASDWQQLNLAQDWLILIDLMKILANAYGEDNVRLVASES